MKKHNYLLDGFLDFFKPTKVKFLVILLLDVVIILSLTYYGLQCYSNTCISDIFLGGIQGILAISIFGYIVVSLIETLTKIIEK